MFEQYYGKYREIFEKKIVQNKDLYTFFLLYFISTLHTFRNILCLRICVSCTFKHFLQFCKQRNLCSESIPLKAGMINGPVYFTRKSRSKGESTIWWGIICLALYTSLFCSWETIQPWKFRDLKKSLAMVI